MMQSDVNSFGGDVVLKRVNIACRGKDSILDQKYERKYVHIFIMKISNFYCDRR